MSPARHFAEATALPKRVRVGFLVVVLLAISVATLTPVGHGHSTPAYCIICGDRGLSDALLNIVLFVPLGLGFRFAGLSIARATLFGFAFTLFIEIAQFVAISGRDSSPADVVYNSLGVFLGALLAPRLPRLLQPDRRAAQWLALSAAIAFAGFTTLFLALMQVWVPRQSAEYWAEWTADKGDLEQYTGRVLYAELGSISTRPGSLQNLVAIRDALRRRDPIRVQFIVGQPPANLAPIFALVDDSEHELFLLGAVGADVLVNARRWSNVIRLDSPNHRFEGAMNGFAMGDTVTIEIRTRRGSLDVRVGDRRHQAPLLVGQSWTVLWFDRNLSHRLISLITCIWLAGLVSLVGYWSAYSGWRLAGSAIVLLSVVTPSFLRVTRFSISEVMCVLCALALSFGAGWIRKQAA